MRIEPFAKVVLQMLKGEFFKYSPLTLGPLRFAALRFASCPPEGAREVVVPQLFPAPLGEGCPKDRKGALSNNLDFFKSSLMRIYTEI